MERPDRVARDARLVGGPGALARFAKPRNTNALRSGSRASIRAMAASTTSTGDSDAVPDPGRRAPSRTGRRGHRAGPRRSSSPSGPWLASPGHTHVDGPRAPPRPVSFTGMTTILVTGGAGYVGSVSVAAFLAAGHRVLVLDDLTTGHRGSRPDRRHPPRRQLSGDAALMARLLADEEARGDPPLRGALPGRRVHPADPGRLLPRQRRGWRVTPQIGPRGRGRAHRLLVDRGRLRRARCDSDPGGRPASPHQPIR